MGFPGRDYPIEQEAQEALENVKTQSGSKSDESTRIQESTLKKKVSELGGVDMR